MTSEKGKPLKVTLSGSIFADPKIDSQNSVNLPKALHILKAAKNTRRLEIIRKARNEAEMLIVQFPIASSSPYPKVNRFEDQKMAAMLSTPEERKQ